MAEYIQLPNGAYLELKKGQTPVEGMMAARQLYPDAFKKEEAPAQDTTGFKAAAAAGFERLKGEAALTAGKAGLMDEAKAQQEYEAAQKRAQARFTPTEDSWVESPFQKFKETLGGSVPYMVAPAAAGLAALAAPVSAPVAAGLGLLGAGAVSTGQFTGSNLGAQLGTGKTLEQASGAAALGAAVPQALIDTAAMALIPGIGKLFGSVGSKLTTEQARAIANQTLGKTVMDYTLKTGATAGREGVTEATQQVLERLQAGLNITDEDARKEYIDSFIGGAVLGGTLAPAGRYIERSGAKTQAAKADREDKLKASAALAEQERIAAEKEAAEKQTPEYALEVANQLKTLEQEKVGLRQQIRKVTKDSTTEAEDKAFNKDINEQLRANRRAADELAPEVNRLKKTGLYDQALEQARVAELSPMDYLLERSGEVRDRKVAPAAPDTFYEESGYAMPDVLVPGVERRKAEEAEKARVSAIPAAYAAERIQLAQDQRFEPTGDDYIEYLLQDPYKASLIVQTRTPMPGLPERESDMLRNNLAKRLKVMGKEELAARQADLQAQKPGKEPVNPMAQFLADQDILDIARQEGMTESDIAFVERQAAMPRDTVAQGDLFGEQRVGQAAGVTEERGTIADKLDEMQRQLDIAYAQRNVQNGGQYRETIRGLVEQIRDLQARTALPTTGDLGTATADLQGQLGQLPANLQVQRNSEAKRQAALSRVADKDTEARTDVMSGLVGEITAVRGALRPETITEIEAEVDKILAPVVRYGAQGEVMQVAQQQLDRLSQKWRGGTERGQTATRTVTPTTTSPEMLRDQMDRAFAQNDQSTRTQRRERYAPQDMTVLNQIADNFNAFATNPDRLNMAGEWLNRLTTTGRSSPEMTRDLQAELAQLEEGKRSETETPMRQTAFGLATKPTQTAQQLDLPERFMPKVVAPQSETRVVNGKVQFVSPEDVGPLQGSPAERYAPAKKSTAFATAAEFQKYLASDALKVLRRAMGMGKDTASRMHARLEIFSKKVENISKQLASLEARKQALQAQRKADTNTAIDLLQTAEANLKKIYERLDAELTELQADYVQARQQFDFTAQTVSDIGQKIADNLAQFQSTDTAVVEAAQKTAEAKTAYATAIEQPVNKRTFSALRKARREVITAIEQQITASRKAGADETLLAFLNADLNLQMQLQAEEKVLDRDAQSLLNAGLALEEAAATQQRSRKNQKELKQAQQELAAALEIKGDVAKEAADIDAQLAQVQTNIASAEKELNRVQGIADNRETSRQAETATRAEQENKSAFERKLDEIKIEPLTRAEQDAVAERDKAKLQAFQETTARLAAIPGTRIDFSKRQQMLEAFNAHADQEAQLSQDLKDADTGIEEMQIAREIATDALADMPQMFTPEQIAKFQERIKTANERIEQLTAYSKRLEAQQASMQKAYERAVLATSSDPEIYQQVTKDLDARVEKLNKDIAENEARIAKGQSKSGKKAETKTLAQTRKRVANYKRELKRVEALRSNRLGIKRVDVLTGETVAGQVAAEKRAEQGRPEPQKRIDVQTQEQIDAEEDRANKYDERNTRLIELQRAQSALEAAKEPKTKAKQAERAERLRKLQEDINKQIDLVNEVRPRGMGKVTAAARVQSSAPGKLRAGTQESKETSGISKQPITEKREIAAPTTAKAVEEANTFSNRLDKARTEKEREDIILAKTLDQRQQIIDAVNNNVLTMRRRVEALEEERKTLTGAKSVAANDRLAKINKELDGTPANIQDVETTGLRTMLKKAEGQLEKLSAEITKANEIEADRAYEMLGTEMGGAPKTRSAGRLQEIVDEGEVYEERGEVRRATEATRKPAFAVKTPAMKNLGRMSRLAQKAGATRDTAYAFDGLTYKEAAQRMADTSTSDADKAFFERLVEVFETFPDDAVSYRVYGSSRSMGNTGTAAGVFATQRDAEAVFIRTGLSEARNRKVLMHELAHAASVHALKVNPELDAQVTKLREKVEAFVYSDAGDKFMSENFTPLKMDGYDYFQELYGLTDNKEFIAEAFSSAGFQKVLAEIPSDKPKLSIFSRLVGYLAKALGLSDKAAQSSLAEALALTEKLFNRTRNEIYADSGNIKRAEDVSAYAPANALEELARDLTARPKTLKEKMGSNLALQAEMQAVDMRAGLRDVLKFGDDSMFTQAMYHVRKAEQKMAQMFTVMNSGPLVQYTDSKGLVGYRSSNQNSARDVFDAISDIPVDNPQMKTDIAQAYMVAQRAQNKGLSKLDLGEMGVTEEKLKAALAAANADPTLKAALENVRRKYNAYNKGMIEFLASTGRISKKMAADLLKDGDYVPYYRVRDNGTAELNFGNNVTFNVGDIRRQPYLAELKGGETKLLPLNEAIQQNTLLLTDMALTNNAAKSVAYGLQALGKGMGPVDPATGKRKNLMPIKTGSGPADARTIRFYQEPDPSNPKDTGERHIVVDTKGTLAEGIPAELVVQSLEGASLALPGFMKLGGVAADLLRAGVTRTPLYIIRKLLREPMAASFTGGLESNTFSSIIKAGAEFVRMSRGTSDAQTKLIEKGLIQSNIFAGDMSDMKKMALQLASGKDQNVFEKVFAATDRYAMRADAATLALVLKNAEANGLSEVEADMMTMESMNFYKRGLSPTLQYASRLIPFFNAQIQGLNVLIKAARGNMPFEEQQEIKRKFFNNALLLTATGLVYAMAMEDDETFRNARPRDKYSNFFLPIPGVDEPLKLPIPFEAGYFYSLAVAAVDAMRAETDGKAQWTALKDLFLGSVPGYSSMGMPQIVKPALEVWTNKNFLTGGPVESLRLQGYSTEERYLATTTELAKQLSKAVPILSPIQIEHIVRGYLGVLPLVAAAGANGLFEREGKGEKPEARASDMPLLGSAFQKKYGGGDSDVVYREAQDVMEAKTTFNKMLKEGRREEAVAFRDENRTELALAPAAGQYRQLVGRINEDVRRTQERNDLNAQEKRIRLDALDKAKQQAAERFLEVRRRAEAAQR